MFPIYVWNLIELVYCFGAQKDRNLSHTWRKELLILVIWDMIKLLRAILAWTFCLSIVVLFLLLSLSPSSRGQAKALLGFFYVGNLVPWLKIFVLQLKWEDPFSSVSSWSVFLFYKRLNLVIYLWPGGKFWTGCVMIKIFHDLVLIFVMIFCLLFSRFNLISILPFYFSFWLIFQYSMLLYFTAGC